MTLKNDGGRGGLGIPEGDPTVLGARNDPGPIGRDGYGKDIVLRSVYIDNGKGRNGGERTL